MKRILLLIGTISCGVVFGQQPDLVISGVIDGPLSGGTPKAVELYAINDISDLSKYGIGSANNGGGSDGEEFTLSGTATAGDYIYVASESTGFNTYFGFNPNFTSGVASINGDDAIELFFNGTVVDVFGDINMDGTGQPWDYEDGWAYRKVATGPDGSSFDVDNWIYSGADALDECTINSSCGSAFPIGTYTDAPPEITWDGSESSDWSDPDNWSSGAVPSSGDNVTIVSRSNAPVISSSTVAEVNDLTINSLASLTIRSGGSLAIFGSVTNNGTYTIERNITGNVGGSPGYSILGSPVDGVETDDLGADFIFSYDGSSYSSNLSATATEMKAGQGFFVSIDQSAPLASFTGSPNSGNINYPIGSTGFHLVSNPYSAPISIEEFLDENSIDDGTVYFWDDGGSNLSGGARGGVRGGDYISVNSLGTVTVPNDGDGTSGNQGVGAANNGYITSTQGFFINVPSVTGNVSFTPDMQDSGVGLNADENHYRASRFQKVKLAIVGNDLYNETLVGLGDGATYGRDYGLDAIKIPGNDIIAFYSLSDEAKYAIQGLPSATSESVTAKLGFDLAEASDYTLKVLSMENIEADLSVSILDHATGQSYLLSEGIEIPFSSGSVVGDQRFELLFSHSPVLSVEQQELSSIKVYGDNSSINIETGAKGKQHVAIYQLDGRVSFRGNVDFVNQKAQVKVALDQNQVYVLRVGNESVKFIIR